MSKEMYKEPGFDDTCCFVCGVNIEHIDPDQNPYVDEGFCSEDCKRLQEEKKSIPCIRPMYELLTQELERDTLEGWNKSLYKDSNAGISIRVAAAPIILLSTIVEGSDAEFSKELIWPFDSKEFWAAVQELEDNVAEYIAEMEAEKPITDADIHKLFGRQAKHIASVYDISLTQEEFEALENEDWDENNNMPMTEAVNALCDRLNKLYGENASFWGQDEETTHCYVRVVCPEEELPTVIAEVDSILASK